VPAHTLLILILSILLFLTSEMVWNFGVTEIMSYQVFRELRCAKVDCI